MKDSPFLNFYIWLEREDLNHRPALERSGRKLELLSWSTYKVKYNLLWFSECISCVAKCKRAAAQLQDSLR